MYKTLFRSSFALTAAAALVAVTAPAYANAADEGNVIATSPGSSGPTAAKGREKRYCLVSDFTGSRIPVKVCKTRKQWEAEGVEIPANR